MRYILSDFTAHMAQIHIYINIFIQNQSDTWSLLIGFCHQIHHNISIGQQRWSQSPNFVTLWEAEHILYPNMEKKSTIKSNRAGIEDTPPLVCTAPLSPPTSHQVARSCHSVFLHYT
jgi:hypothetical protein